MYTELYNHNHKINRGVATRGVYRYLYPSKSAQVNQVNFLWGKNDVRMAIQQFYTPQKTFIPQNKFLAMPLKINIHVLVQYRLTQQSLYQLLLRGLLFA